MQTEKREQGLAVVTTSPAPETTRPEPAGVEEITLAGLWRTFRRGAWLVAVVALLTVLVAAAWLKLSTPLYLATMTVAPASRDLASAGRLASELGQYASFATLAQTPSELEQVSTLDRYLAVLISNRVAARLIEDRALVTAIFQDQWDESAADWRPPDGLVPRLKEAILGFFGFPGWQPPGPEVLASALRERIRVLGSTGIYRLTAADADPALAASLLRAVHGTADDILREDALARVRTQIGQIEADLAQTRDDQRRDALQALLAEHYQTEALLAADQAYAAEVIDPATAGTQPTSASPFLILALAGFVGLVIGIFIVFLRDALRGARV